MANKHAIEANKNAINEALFLVGDDPLPDSDLRSYASDIHNNYVNNRADSDLNDLEYVQHGAIKVDEAIFDKLQQLFANYGFSKDHIDFLVSNQAIDHAIYMKRWTKYAKLGYKPERIERIIFEEDEAETEKEEPMGLGRLHHARFASMPAVGARRGADLRPQEVPVGQLVESVCPFGQPRSTTRGDHQPAVVETWVAESAEQLNIKSVWQLCCDHLKHTLAAIGPPPTLRLLPDHANGVG